MIDYGLEIVVYVLKVWQIYLFLIGVVLELQLVQVEVWLVVVVYGVLVYDIGKIVVDLQVELQDGSIWYFWNGLINQFYCFKYVKFCEYQFYGVVLVFFIY